MEPTIYKPSIYKGAGIYKTGAEGGGGSPLETSQPVFVRQMTGDKESITYDARLDNILYNLPDGYKKVLGIKNGSDNPSISTGIIPYEDKSMEILTAFFVHQWASYKAILGNTYVSDSTNLFSIYCGGSLNTIIGFVHRNFQNANYTTYDNGSAIVLKYDPNNNVRICKDVIYPYTSFLSGSSGTKNESQITLFRTSDSIKTIYSFYCKQDGIVIADYVPCVRLSDNKPGFYDKISRSFKTDEENTLIAVE